MAENELDELGPVDYLVVEFPPGQSHFNGEMAAELAKLVDSGTVRVLDLLIVAKDENGQIEGMEIEDLDQLDELRRAEMQLADLLAAEDIVNLAAAMKPGTVAGVLVWENSWACAIRRRSPTIRRATHCQWTHSDPSHPRRAGGGRGNSRRLTCHSDQPAPPAEASSAPLLPAQLQWWELRPSSRTV